MTTWAFRVYSFSVKYGSSRLPLGEEASRDAVFEIIDDVAAANVLRGLPRQQLGGDADATNNGEEEAEYEAYAPSSPTLTVRNAERRSETHVHLIVGMGDAGLHENLSDPDTKTSTNIQRQSAEVSLRLDFFFPDEGEEGVIVAEVQGMRDPVQRLLKWMTLLWKIEKEERQRKRREERSEWDELNAIGKASGKKPKVIDLRNYYFTANRLADPALLQKIIDEANEGTAEFFELAADGTRKHTLTRKLKTREDIVSVGRLLSSGFGTKTSNLQSVASSSVLKLAGDLGYDTEALEGGGLNLDDAKLRLATDETSATFDSTHASDVFSYKFQKGRPKDSGFYSMALSKVVQLSSPAGIEMTTPSWEEVSSWLTEAPGRSPSDLP